MKKFLLLSACVCANFALAQFTSGTVTLGSTGMTLKLDTNTTTVTITLTGPSNCFLGIGLGNQGMASGADGFIYNSTANRDYTFGGVGITPSADAQQDWTVSSNTVAGTTRTVVASRSLAGGPGDTPIPNAAGGLDIFFSRGDNTLVLSYHGANRDYATLNMTAQMATQDTNFEKSKISIYPNPAKEIVNFKNSENIKSISTFDASGRRIKLQQMERNQLNISSLKKGVYYFEIQLNDGTTVYEKIIKE